MVLCWGCYDQLCCSACKTNDPTLSATQHGKLELLLYTITQNLWQWVAKKLHTLGVHRIERLALGTFSWFHEHVEIVGGVMGVRVLLPHFPPLQPTLFYPISHCYLVTVHCTVHHCTLAPSSFTSETMLHSILLIVRQLGPLQPVCEKAAAFSPSALRQVPKGYDFFRSKQSQTKRGRTAARTADADTKQWRQKHTRGPPTRNPGRKEGMEGRDWRWRRIENCLCNAYAVTRTPTVHWTR